MSLEGKPEHPAPHFEYVDRKSPEIMEGLAQAQIYKKVSIVRARPAIAGERITTTLVDGREETSNRAQEGEWVVTNSQGEEYIVPEEKFNVKYQKGSEEGIYRAVGFVRAFKNPFGKPIEIQGKRSSLRKGDSDCFIVDGCDEEGVSNGEPYLVDGSVFAKTYATYTHS
ncbi:hypothetical protein H0X32_00565 [Patescibacteria group bacterium]|nr:hypothetical protein [Patescibacteria group bacterium]